MAALESGLYGHISRKDYLGFMDNSSMNYGSVARFLDLDKADISKIAKVKKISVRYDDKIPKEVKEHLENIANICQLVAESFEGDVRKTALWFKVQNPLLGYVSPRDMIKFGRYKKLMQFIIDARKSALLGDKEEEEEAA